MDKIKFNIAVVINAVELFKYNFEAATEAEYMFTENSIYMDQIRNEMEERDIFKEYVDLLDFADPKDIYKDYVSVDEDGIEFGFTEAENDKNRANCHFMIPCSFDLEKYVMVMDQGRAEESGIDDVISVMVYKDTVFPGRDFDDNLTTITVKKDIFMKYFRERILPDFKGDDETVSDEGLLQEWLDEYTADDTDDLYEFVEKEKYMAKYGNELMVVLKGSDGWLYYLTNKTTAAEAFAEFTKSCEHANINIDNMSVDRIELRDPIGITISKEIFA